MESNKHPEQVGMKFLTAGAIRGKIFMAIAQLRDSQIADADKTLEELFHVLENGIAEAAPPPLPKTSPPDESNDWWILSEEEFRSVFGGGS